MTSRAGRAVTSDLALYLRALRMGRPWWLHVLGVLATGLLAVPIALLAPLPLKIAVDHVIGDAPILGWIGRLIPPFARGSDARLLGWVAAMVVVMALLAHAQRLAAGLLRTYVGERLVLDFRARLFRHSQRLSLLYHDIRGTADSIYRIQYDSTAIQDLVVEGPIPFITSIVTLTAMIVVTARIDSTLAVVALGACLPLYLVTRAYRRRLRPQWRRVKSLESSGLSVIQEVMTSLRVVKSFGQEEREQERFVRRYRESLAARLRLVLDEGGFDLSVGMIMSLGTALILLLGVRHVQSGVLSLGELLLVMGYLTQLYEPLRTISKHVTKIQNSLAGAERAFALLDEAPEVEERPAARALCRARGEIEFDDLGFSYGGEAVLRDIAFHVGPGTRVGITGRTGAGKTTLVSLLTRLYDPTSGAIRLDGVDLREYRLADLRNQYAIVLQDSVLLSTSIAENIAYARPEARLSDIEAAARAANIHDFIASLPEGYDTPVGERGMRLSGGERQRIALARAFLKDAPILILDEPTSALDVRTEALIFEAMVRLMADRTSFLIAHRLSTLAACDFLLVLDEGRVVTATRDVAAAIASIGPIGPVTTAADGSLPT